MITTIDTATTANGKKVGASKKTKSTPKVPLKAATIAKTHGIDPKKFRKALRAQNIRAPYDAAAILKIERIAKEMAFVS